MRPAIAAAVLLACPWAASTRASAEEHDPILHARRVVAPPVIDGVLDDEAWSGDPLPMGAWVSYNPLRGEPARYRTEVWIACDDRAIYVAFRAFDPEPDRIRTTISRRDNIWNDDWVAISLDSSRAGQAAYHMFVNPSGIQMDALQTAGAEDSAADWVWQSAGQVTDDGYVVEIRVPLESLRFAGGTDVRMGVTFFRRISRLGVSWSWPEMPPGTWVFEAHVPLALGSLRQPRLLEVIPSATLSRNQARAMPPAWQGVSRGDLGASLKYGLTSTMTLDGTANPDFSQVESDAFEVEVNQRFPVFFSEKRPFFMEGMGLFNIAGAGGDSNLRTAVHTRRIVEPSAGVKLTGTAGSRTIALLSAGDRSAGGDAQKIYTIGRVLQNFAPGQYAGALATDTEHQGRSNRVIGGDLALRHGQYFRWNGSILSSHTTTADGHGTRGAAAQLSYGYSTRRFTLAGQAEHFDRDFQMDTAFLNRVGITRGWQYADLQFYPNEASRAGWVKRISPFVWTTRGSDRLQGGGEHFVHAGLRFNFTRQGFLQLSRGRGRETFAGQRFTTGQWLATGNAQITRWLNLGGSVTVGPAIFYDPASPFQGTRRAASVRAGLQPSPKLNHNVAYNFVTFERRDTGEKVFDVHVVNLRTTYQFTPQFLLRALAQLDTSRRRILTDFLASYELVPGTVVHLGYGTLLDRLEGDRYLPTARALFFKASYLARF